MSVWNLSRVWKQARYSEGTLLVLMALADWSDDEGYCFPKVGKLAKAARLSERATQRALRRLVADKALTIEAQPLDGHSPNTYRIGVTFLHPSFQSGGDIKSPQGCHLEQRNKEDSGLEDTREPSVGSLFKGGTSQPTEAKPPIPAISCRRCGGKGFHEAAQRPGWDLYCDCPAGAALKIADHGPAYVTMPGLTPPRRNGR